MPRSKSNSSQGIRAPFEPIKNLYEVPGALYEIKWLAGQDGAERIGLLIDSIIKITQADPDAWTKLQAQPCPAPAAA